VRSSLAVVALPSRRQLFDTAFGLNEIEHET